MEGHTGADRDRRRAVLRALGLTVMMTAAATRCLASSPLVDSVEPAVGRQGTAHRIEGQGFDGDPERHLVYLTDGLSGAGAQVVEASPSVLTFVVGASEQAIDGTLALWLGQTYTLSGSVVARGDRLYRLRRNRLFLGSDGSAPVPFEVDQGSPRTEGSQLVVSRIGLLFDGAIDFGQPIDVRVKLVAKTGGPPKRRVAGEGDEQNPTSGLCASLSFDLAQIDSAAAAVLPEVFAADLASVLAAQLDALGFSVEAVGAGLEVAHAGGIASGFLVVEQLSAAPAGFTPR